MAVGELTELVSPFPDSHFSLRSYESLVSNVFPGADGSHVLPVGGPWMLGLGLGIE
jgi:hypothetical protein